MMNRRAAVPELGAAEAAWLILEMISVGLRMHALGWCLGPLRPGDLLMTRAGLERRLPRSSARRLLLRYRGQRHLREGHDFGCRALGVPGPALERILAAWVEPRALGFARALLPEVLREVRREWDAAPEPRG
ncbi:hypothetical protein ACFPZL_09315, partial [Leucobacter soli]|uniref:hypothetical protein n=1 Tax=Leucobacter soli TaxID=2812850 RepID=UPI003618BE86